MIAFESNIFRKKFIGNKNVIANIYRIQPYNSIMCGYFCIGFIHFMLKGISSKYLWNRGKKFKGYELYLFSSITFNTRIPHRLFNKINEMIERFALKIVIITIKNDLH